MRKLSLIGISLLLLVGLSARELSLENCLDAALQNNVELKSAKLTLQNSASEHSSNLYDFLPSAQVYGSAKYDIDENQIGTLGFSASTSYYLFDDRHATARLSKLSMKSQKESYLLSKYGVMQKVVSLYSEVLQLEKSVELYENSVEIYSSEEGFIKELLKVGKRNELDLYSTQIELQNARLNLSQTKNSLRKKKLELSREVGFEIGEGAHFVFRENLLGANLDQGSLANNPNLKIEKNTLQENKVTQFNSFKNLFPQLYISGSYSKNYTEYWEVGNALNDSLGGDWDRDYSQENWEVSLNASFSFGDLMQKYKRNSINKRNLRKQIYNLDLVTQQKEDELIAQKMDLELKSEEIEIVTKKLELAEKKFQLSQERFRRGLISFLDYKTAMNEKINASIELLTSKNAYLLEMIEWQKLNGQKVLGRY